jgi:hypothetical protein
MPSSKKRKKPPIHITGVIIFFLSVICLCIYDFYFLRPTPKVEKPLPVKPQEIINYSPSCRQINQYIYHYFQDLGASEKDFNILEQRTIREAKKKWIYTRRQVFLPKELGPTGAADDLIEKLKELSNILSFQWEERKENRVSLSIRYGEVLTYSLTINRRLPRLAIIIDDIGGDLEITREFLDLGIPLTLSILPDLPYSKESEELAHKRGYEVMLHLPMEPKDLSFHNPGEGAIYLDMDKNEIYDTIISHINKFEYIKGVNNHMGSRITENEQIMHWVLSALKPFGLYFVDSRTSSQSIAYKVAQEMGIPAGKNSFFIDNEPEVNYCKNCIDKAIQQVKREGKVIVIGHPRETTLQALKELDLKIQDEEISLVFVSELMQ